MNTLAKTQQRARTPAPASEMHPAPSAAAEAAHTAPSVWWMHGWSQHFLLQQSLWDMWKVWAWIPWNLSLSAWQMSEQQPAASPEGGWRQPATMGGHGAGVPVQSEPPAQ